MPLDLADHLALAREAVQYHWEVRNGRHLAPGKSAAHAVRGGKHLDGFVRMFKVVAEANGLPGAAVHVRKATTTLPGFYRATKDWDVVLVHEGVLVAALELKSQVGSVGNNFNNRTEEVLGSATDLLTAFREGALGDGAPKPFMGYMMLLEDNAAAHRPVPSVSTHFGLLPEFEDASYAERYHVLCRKLVAENLYDAASLLLTDATHGLEAGDFREYDEGTGLRRLVAGYAGAVAAQLAS